MKCLRNAVNKTRRDKIRNEVIRDMAGAQPVLQRIKQQQVKWFGHITRMPINQPALQAYNTKYSGWRARGRPRKRWSDSVADTLRTQGMSLLQATHLAADRQLCPPLPRYKRKKKVKVLFVGCLSSQQHASVSQGRICTDNFTCCHTEIEAADQTFQLTQSQYTDTGPTSPSADPITPGAWQGSHWSANF